MTSHGEEKQTAAKFSRRRRSIATIRKQLQIECLEDRAVPASFGLTQATNLPSGTGIDFFAVDDAGTRMVYTQTNSGYGLHVVDLGTSQDKLITSAGAIFRPALSGDGSTIAFFGSGDYTGNSKNTDGSIELFTYNVGTQTFKQITETTGAAALGSLGATVSLNFDGSKIAYSFLDQSDNNLQIFVANSDGSGTTQLSSGATTYAETNNFPVLSGDGNRLLFQQESSGVENLFVYEYSGGSWNGVFVITNNDTDDSIFSAADLSADGQYVVYSGVEAPNGVDDPNVTYQIYRVKVNDGTFSQITSGTKFSSNTKYEDSILPSISADGSRVVYLTQDNSAAIPNPNNYNKFVLWNSNGTFSDLTPNYTSASYPSTSSIYDFDGTAISANGRQFFFAIYDQDPSTNVAFAPQTEQIYRASALYAYDFDNASKFTATGFTSIQGNTYPTVGAPTPTLFTPGNAGWVGTAPTAIDQGSVYGASQALLRDSNTDTVSQTFRADVGTPTTEYFVTAIVSGNLNGMTITGANGTVVATGLEASQLSNIVTPANQSLSLRFKVTSNASGLIDLAFGGPAWGISGLLLSEVASHSSLKIVRQDGLATTVLADGLTEDTYIGTGAKAGSLVDLSISLGTISSVSTTGLAGSWVSDASTLLAGKQVFADATGKFFFKVQRPNSATNTTAKIIVHPFDGTAHGEFTQMYAGFPITTPQVPPVTRKLDLDPNLNTTVYTEAGWTSYKGGAYNSSVGYGWTNVSGISIYNRATAGLSLLNRDGHSFTQTRDFQIDVTPNTAYTINIGFGDNNSVYDKLKVEFIGGTSQSNIATSAAARFTSTTVSGVSDANGKITVRFSDLGGANLAYGVTFISATPGSPLVTSTSSSSVTGPVNSISSTEVQGLINTAIDFWSKAGATSSQISILKNTKVEVVDLGGTLLGSATPGSIKIDDNAGGTGWSNSASTVQNGKYDLLTVLMHEMGHLLGLDDTYKAGSSSIMTGKLNPGSRVLPTVSDLATIAAPIPTTPPTTTLPTISGSKVDSSSVNLLTYFDPTSLVSVTPNKRR
jgi:hypothetical protein